MTDPRVLQFNDCAFVARAMVRAAGRAGLQWDYLPPEKVRPMTAAPSNPVLARARFVPYVAQRAARLWKADAVHVHYATSARLLRERGMPERPYALTLHGTDIRKQWADPVFHDEIQRAIDGAAHVFYANNDTAANALKARPDAEFLPALVDAASLPAWQPDVRPNIFFVSRWDDDKGVERQLGLARQLRRALDPEVRILGLNWGPGAARAAEAGVTLLERMSQEEYHRVMSRTHVAVGQATNNFATSEFEALCMGLPVAAVGTRLARPDDGSTPPVLEGTEDDVVAQILEALSDPEAAARRLAGSAWALPRYDAAAYVDRLEDLYRKIARR
ncbi:glycosyltransferase family 4 protein [Arthrobacter sp. C9C5]|uniref:glycosyltransferase family 4 protein n=1 Tax=Arthrobacter sp. C9C5 TaxID=2735267 RepID=UPI001585A5C5|nr:glycosyltransferase family 4 protein [Arthrobacter sp. C9C5]NUU31085.1 glycosyltransferase family 4 protein [Arthrobacter sp. C9C5]